MAGSVSWGFVFGGEDFARTTLRPCADVDRTHAPRLLVEKKKKGTAAQTAPPFVLAIGNAANLRAVTSRQRPCRHDAETQLHRIQQSVVDAERLIVWRRLRRDLPC